MGMFDYLRCDYPLPLDGANAREYQTKNTPRQYLDQYVITEDGRLKHCEMDYDAPEPREGKWVWDGDFLGEIRFYEYGDDRRWIEFSAYFVAGMLKELHLVSDEKLPEPSPTDRRTAPADARSDGTKQSGSRAIDRENRK